MRFRRSQIGKGRGKPIHTTIAYARIIDFSRMIAETDCEQNERDPVVNGRFTTITH